MVLYVASYGDGGYKTAVVAIVLIVMQILMVSARLLSRRLQNVTLGSDDCVLILAMASSSDQSGELYLISPRSSPVDFAWWALCVCTTLIYLQPILESLRAKANLPSLVPRIAGVGQQMEAKMMHNPSAAKQVGRVCLTSPTRQILCVKSTANLSHRAQLLGWSSMAPQ